MIGMIATLASFSAGCQPNPPKRAFDLKTVVMSLLRLTLFSFTLVAQDCTQYRRVVRPAGLETDPRIPIT